MFLKYTVNFSLRNVPFQMNKLYIHKYTQEIYISSIRQLAQAWGPQTEHRTLTNSNLVTIFIMSSITFPPGIKYALVFFLQERKIQEFIHIAAHNAGKPSCKEFPVPWLRCLRSQISCFWNMYTSITFVWTFHGFRHSKRLVVNCT